MKNKTYSQEEIKALRDRFTKLDDTARVDVFCNMFGRADFDAHDGLRARASQFFTLLTTALNDGLTYDKSRAPGFYYAK